MGYQHDIFVSYKRHPETLRWIEDHFRPLLEHHVANELERDPKIYVNEISNQIPAGTAWPASLGQELGTSRILLALWSGAYLNSVWCAEELTTMMVREQKYDCRTPQNQYGLIIPVVVHDGDEIPEPLGVAQAMDIKTCYNTRMRRDGAKAEELSDKIVEHARGIAIAITKAPKWQEDWPIQAAQQLFNKYYKAEASQRRVPRFNPQ